MAGGAQITVAGNLGSDPELRYTPNGLPVCNFTVAVGERKFNKGTNEWEDAGTTWFRVNAWRDLAEHIAESLQRGYSVIVTGTLRARKYTTREGVERDSWEITAEDVGASLRRATAKISKIERGSGQAAGRQQQTAQDPWADSGPGGQFGDEPPF